jgi:hypothetical protein
VTGSSIRARGRSRRLIRMAPAATVLAVLAALAVVIGACGATPQGSGDARLTVSRDFGSRILLRASEPDVPSDETVMRFLQRHADVETRYGGRFVNAIEGIGSRSDGAKRQDWFYYVNGIEADVGAAERTVHEGDRVWWDFHDWSAVMRVPAVVGSFPEPFLHGSEGKLFPVRIDCGQDAQDACEDVANRLEREEVTASTSAIGAGAGKDVLRLVVGTWNEVREDGAARRIEQGPDVSGVFANFLRAGSGYELALFDSAGRVAQRVAGGAGLVAATRFEEQQPTWVVTGTDEAGLDRAVALVDERLLRDRFALAAVGPSRVPLPVDTASPKQ